ncbi:MAG: PD-(D/E)XK nuclease family protein [Candidatus Diapherotrites archaeon]
MTIYSHSRIETFYQCPLKFNYKYIDRVKVPRQEGIEAFMGKMVHETLEQLYKWVQLTKVPGEKELLDYYKKLWSKNWNNSIVITKEGLTKKHYYNLGAKCIRNYYRRHHPFDDGTTIGLEKYIAIDLDMKGKYKVQGYIDRLVEKENGAYEIHDYKTSASLPDQVKLDEDRQLALYAIGLDQLFGDMKSVELVWHYVAFDKELRSKRTKEQLKALRKETIARIGEIECCMDYPPKKSALCGWCEYQNLCPECKHTKETEKLSANKYLNEPGVKLANRFIELKNRESEIKTELAEVKEAVIAYAKKKGYTVIEGSDRKLSISKTETLRVPKKDSKEYEKLEKLLHKLNCWEECSCIDQTKIKEMLDGKA